jgi:hypothetical protein
MKHTSVEWLEKEFVKLESTIGVHGIMYELIEQAKELEKKQQGYSNEEVEVIAKDAYTMGRNNILIGVFNKWVKQFKNK